MTGAGPCAIVALARRASLTDSKTAPGAAMAVDLDRGESARPRRRARHSVGRAPMAQAKPPENLRTLVAYAGDHRPDFV